MLTRRALVGTAAIAGAAPFLAYGDLFPPAFAATPKTVGVMARSIDDIVSLDPAESYEFSDNEVDGNCYRKLVVPDPADLTTLTGDLAEHWDVSADGLTFTFHLRGDALFDSGKPVTAADAEFSLHRVVILDKTPAFIISQFGFTKDNVAKLIRATDPRTLVVTLPSLQATSLVLYCLSANVGCVVEKATALANQSGSDLGNAWLKTHSAGAGPFRLTAWEASNHVALEANPHASVAPHLKRFIIRHVPEPSAQLLLLQKGDVDIARNLTSDQLKNLRGNADYHILSKPQMTSLYIAMNEGIPELAKPQMHQAIKWAIGYDAIAENITPTTWSVDQSFLPKGLPGALTEPPFHKDVAKARALIAEAGLPAGFALTMDCISTSPYIEIGQAIQADLGAIGLKVQLLPGEQKQVITKTRERKHQLALLYWSADYFDPNSNAQAFCANPDDSDTSKLRITAWRSHFVDKELTAQALAASKETDNAKRVALYQQMQREFWERAPFAFLLQQNDVAVLRRDVTGLVLGPLFDYTKYVGIEKT